MGFVNYEPFIRFRQLTKLSRPGGRVSDRVTRSRVHALPILYREGPKHMCTCALSTVGRSGILRRFRLLGRSPNRVKRLWERLRTVGLVRPVDPLSPTSSVQLISSHLPDTFHVFTGPITHLR